LVRPALSGAGLTGGVLTRTSPAGYRQRWHDRPRRKRIKVEQLMDLRGYRQGTLLGRLMRLPFRLIPRWMPVPFVQGALRGKWWIAGSGDKSHWLGLYELETRRCMEAHVRKGAVVFDVGAHHGLYTLLASVLVGPTGRVFSFEPLPQNARILDRHLRMNRIRNVRVLNRAASDVTGTARFSTGISHWEGSLNPGGQLEVATVALDDVVGDEVPAPDVVKMDVEGAEERVLKGARNMLQRHRPLIVFEAHTETLRMSCTKLLEEIGYEVTVLAGPPPEGGSFHLLAKPR
jgi:FkbM family methyltransferase